MNIFQSMFPIMEIVGAKAIPVMNQLKNQLFSEYFSVNKNVDCDTLENFE